MLKTLKKSSNEGAKSGGRKVGRTTGQRTEQRTLLLVSGSTIDMSAFEYLNQKKRATNVDEANGRSHLFAKNRIRSQNLL